MGGGVALDTRVALTVGATGDSLTYLWRKEGIALPSATRYYLEFPSFSSSNLGNYDVVITDAKGASVVSDVATLTVGSMPVITQDSSDLLIALGQTATFQVTAEGENLTYGWELQGGWLTHDPSAQLDLPSVGFENEGFYRAYVRNRAGLVYGRWSKLTIASPPIIGVQPVSTQVRVGVGWARLSVGAPGAWNSFQWRKGGVPVPEATHSFLDFSAIHPSDIGDYDVVVTNSQGSVTSVVATLEEAPPFAIVEQPQDLLVEPGETATLSVVATGFGKLEYIWYRYPLGTLSMPLSFESTFSPTPTLTPTRYIVEVRENYTRVYSQVATVTTRMAPAIDVQPIRQIIAPGSAAQFAVQAKGTLPLSYQWHKNGVPIAGATSPALSLGSVGSAHEGSYSVTITNTFGSLASVSVPLRLISGTPYILSQPVNSVASSGINQGFSVKAVANPPPTYQWFKNGVRLPGEVMADLMIADADRGNVGAYHVRVTSTTSVDSEKAQLAIADGPSQETEKILKNLGESVEINIASFGGGITYTWTRAGSPLPVGRFELLQGGKVLRLKSLEAGDAGEYLCTVNTIGIRPVSVLIGYSLSVVSRPPRLPRDAVLPSVSAGSIYGWVLPTEDVPGQEIATLRATGLPPGLKLEWKPGSPPVIFGRVMVARSEAYQVTFTATNSAGSDSITLPLQVAAFPVAYAGSYHTLLPRNDQTGNPLGGELRFTVTPVGTVTCRVTIGASTWTFAGRLHIEPGDDVAKTYLFSQGAPTVPRRVSIMLSPDSPSASCELSGFVGSETIACEAERSSWTLLQPLPSELVGQFNIALRPGLSEPDVPRGAGWLILRVTKPGLATWTGRSADKQSLAGSGPITDSLNSSFFAKMHSNSSSLLGTVKLGEDSVDGTFSWKKARQVRPTISYQQGFPIHQLSAFGGKHAHPGSGALLLGIVPGMVENCKLVLDDTALPGTASQGFTVIANHAVAKPKVSEPNTAAALKLSALGTYAGTLTRLESVTFSGLTEPRKISRNLNFEGVFIERPDFRGALGYCIAPSLPLTAAQSVTATPLVSILAELKMQ